MHVIGLPIAIASLVKLMQDEYMRHLLVFVLFFVFSLPAFALDLSAPLLRAIEDENWHIALEEARGDDIASDYVKWRAYQDYDTDVSFGELARFVSMHEDWPGMNRIQLRAEKALFQSGERSKAALRWLNNHPPISGYGMLALARMEPARELIRQGWIQGDFESLDKTLILAEFGEYLDPATHRSRAERLLSQRQASVAEHLLDYVGDDYARLYRARIAIQRNDRALDAKIGRIPKQLQSDHGLLADRALWRHRKGLASGTRELLRDMHSQSPYADDLWRIRASYVRDAIEAGSYNDADELLQNSGLLNVVNQADALWLKGWLDLTFRKKAKEAYQHFATLYQSVNYPVSRARGAYWSAKAAQAMGDGTTALDWLHQAARYPSAFYGQLAHSELSPNAPLSLPAQPAVSDAAYRRYRDHPLMELVVALHEAGMDKLWMPLLYHLTLSAEHGGEFAALMKLCREHEMLHGQVRVAKMALRENIIFRDGWPIIDPPAGSPLPPELALAISRQESEFNPIAVSRANARGLMQLLPSTARKVARTLGKDYSLELLFDPVYNMRLGSQYLADLIAGFDGNYILAIAGYNAGPGRSRQWVSRFGNPGGSLDDTLTFIELIPFSETRNYVQRVLENVQMYRHLRAPNSRVSLQQDLLR